jgi:hypothetical protein
MVGTISYQLYCVLVLGSNALQFYQCTPLQPTRTIISCCRLSLACCLIGQMIGLSLAAAAE